MRCNSCGARSDPTRSFCRRCGSAVFVDDGIYASLRAAAAAATASISAPDHTVKPDAVSGPSNPVPRVAQAARQAARRVRTQPPQVAAAGAGCLGSLIRTALFLGFVYFILNSLGVWPVIRQTASAVANGEQVDLLPVVNQLRALVDLPPLDRFDNSGSGESTPSQQPSAEPVVQQPSTSTPPAIDTGGPSVIPPRAVTRVQPRYPAEAFERGIQGVVVVTVTVEPDGTVSYADISKSVEGLDAAALAAARQWRFEPAQQGGQRVRATTTISLTFRKQ